MSGITLNYQIEVLGNGKMPVPNCESTSSLTSRTLSAYLAGSDICSGALVDVKDALAAIPGSFLKYGANHNLGYRLRYFVFPPIPLDCPCQTIEDYYRILRQIDTADEPIDDLDECNVNDQGFFKIPDDKPPVPDPYKPEGTFPPGVGILPPVPPWALG